MRKILLIFTISIAAFTVLGMTTSSIYAHPQLDELEDEGGGSDESGLPFGAELESEGPEDITTMNWLPNYNSVDFDYTRYSSDNLDSMVYNNGNYYIPIGDETLTDECSSLQGYNLRTDEVLGSFMFETNVYDYNDDFYHNDYFFDYISIDNTHYLFNMNDKCQKYDVIEPTYEMSLNEIVEWNSVVKVTSCAHISCVSVNHDYKIIYIPERVMADAINYAQSQIDENTLDWQDSVFSVLAGGGSLSIPFPASIYSLLFASVIVIDDENLNRIQSSLIDDLDGLQEVLRSSDRIYEIHIDINSDSITSIFVRTNNTISINRNLSDTGLNGIVENDYFGNLSTVPGTIQNAEYFYDNVIDYTTSVIDTLGSFLISLGFTDTEINEFIIEN